MIRGCGQSHCIAARGVTIADRYALKAVTGDVVMNVLTACGAEDRRRWDNRVERG